LFFGVHYIETTSTVVEITPTVFTLFVQHQLDPITTLVNKGGNTITTLIIDPTWYIRGR